MRKTLKNLDEGQAIVEYILMVLFALTLVAVIATGFRRTILRVWGFYIHEITAGCPGCPSNPSYRFR